MKRSYSVAIATTVHRQALDHLVRADGQEDLCFALWYPSQGRRRTTALIEKLILPGDGDRRVHGNASFFPQYFERALHQAIKTNAGLAFLHSHPAVGWQGMSSDDIHAELRNAGAVNGATGLPFVGLTVGKDGAWSGRFWERTGPRVYERQWCANVRVVGEQFSVTYMDELCPVPASRDEQIRTVSSWGESVQADLARLRVGVVGAGSVGSIVAEALARTGIANIVFIDFDSVERRNLDRQLHASEGDIGRAKVSVLADALRLSATAMPFNIEEVEFGITEDEGFRAALDCDVLFSCVDRPWSRSVLNFIAYAHLIPVIDGGIQVEVTKIKTLKRADWRAHIATPGSRCLACLSQYDPALVPVEREGYLDDPNYITGLSGSHHLRRNENVFVFSLSTASFQLLQMLMMVVAPMGISSPGAQMYHFVPGILDEPKFCRCLDSCPYPDLIAKGDRTGFSVTGDHKIAAEQRALRSKRSPNKQFR